MNKQVLRILEKANRVAFAKEYMHWTKEEWKEVL